MIEIDADKHTTLNADVTGLYIGDVSVPDCFTCLSDRFKKTAG